jgi:integrase
MSTQPTRRRLEPGIYERVGPDGARLGLEIVFKDAAGSTRRRSVHGGIQDARDALAQARTRRVGRETEPNDPRITFETVCAAFEAAHVAGLRLNSQQVYAAALKRLRAAFRGRRLSSITKADVRAYVALERREGLKANTIASHLKALSAIYTFARDDLGMPVAMPRLKAGERPQPADDQREHRILTDQELAAALKACDERTGLFFRTLAETGARKSEGLGLTRRRVDVQAATVTFAKQLDDDGELAPLKTHVSGRTIEVTRALAAELALAAGPARVFEHLAHDAVDQAWRTARVAVAHPLPVVHDLRHTHVSGLIADGWDPVEVAARIGDTLETTLRVYAHEFDARRRSEQRRAVLEARYGDGMATHTRQQTATDAAQDGAQTVDLQAVRGRGR